MKKKLNSILLIEDNEFTNIFNQKLIKNLDITERVYIAESGKEGIDFLLKNGKFKTNDSDHSEPDIIFLDINMPGMNGWEFLEEYKKIKNNTEGFTKIIMLTTSPNPDDEYKAKLISDIIAFKRKPLTKDIIYEILTKYFAEYL